MILLTPLSEKSSSATVSPNSAQNYPFPNASGMSNQVGKSRVVVELNREINKINLLIHSHYNDLVKRFGKVAAVDVKNAFQGMASSQITLLVLFHEMMQEFQSRIGIDRAASTYYKYITAYKNLKHLTWGDIITEEDGSLWIFMSRQKTDISFNVKLLDPYKLWRSIKE